MNNLLEDRQLINDINWLRKKVENLSSSILSMKNDGESNNNSYSNKMSPMDNRRYVDYLEFNEFKTTTNEEIDTINFKISDLRKMIEDILASLKNKAEIKDLKDLEGNYKLKLGYLLQRIEELKIASSKKFADKNETAKNLKYLDQQVNYILT